MQQKEVFNDWLFRYQYIYRSRLLKASKQRFLKALVTDIAQIREDIQVIEYARERKFTSRNIYVGDVEKADRIICTYYDTPPQYFSSYLFFNRKEQGRRTTRFILAYSILMVFFGILGTLSYIQFMGSGFVLLSLQTLGASILIVLYFILLGRMTKGVWRNKNLVRNTSSVLTLLQMISETKNKRMAFAFIDEGSYGEKGLEVLEEISKKDARIFYLDSIGANAQLHALGKDFSRKRSESLGIKHIPSKNRINYLFSAKSELENEQEIYYLDKKELNKKTLNKDNMLKAVALLS